MAIESSKKSENRVISAQEKSIDTQNENALRPKTLSDYMGQERIKKHLEISIKAAKIRKSPLEHIIFYGAPGLGKTTISQIIANEMDANIRITSGPAIEKQADLVSILSNLEENDVLFIDEIHRLRPQIEEILYTAMEDFTLDIMVGKGTGANSVRMPIPPFTLIGATTRLSALSAPLRDRFGNVLKLEFYQTHELQTILEKNAQKLGFQIEGEIAEKIASRSRGTPRIGNRLLKILRDYHTVWHDLNNSQELSKIFDDLHIDDLGLDSLDTAYLQAILTKFSGGPVGLGTLSSTLGEEEDTLEDVVEPYLLQIGFIERTPRGRKITHIAENHLHNSHKI